MKLVLLGTTGYHPNNRRQTACFMLPEAGVVLDAGTAMFRVRDLIETSHLDILLSHAHLDHIVGLTFLYNVLHEKGVQQVTVHAEDDKLAAIRQHLLSELLFPVDLPCKWATLAAKIQLCDGGIVSSFPLRHPGGSVGYRIDWPDRSMAYITDTTANVDADYVERIRGVDLLLHECYFPDGREQFSELTGHSCVTPVAQVARAAEVGRMILVHVNPQSEADDPIGLPTAQAIFPNTEIGEDGMEVEF